jgi:hypothetical protein
VAQKLDAKQLYLYKNVIYKDLAQWRQQDQHFQCSELPDRETKRLCSIFALSNKRFHVCRTGHIQDLRARWSQQSESQKVLPKCRPRVLDA